MALAEFLKSLEDLTTAAREAFAAAGARVIITARRKDRLVKLASELKSDCLPIELDVRNQPEVEKTIADLPKNWQEIDILVNNAGLARGLSKVHEGTLPD